MPAVLFRVAAVLERVSARTEQEQRLVKASCAASVCVDARGEEREHQLFISLLDGLHHAD